MVARTNVAHTHTPAGGGYGYGEKNDKTRGIQNVVTHSKSPFSTDYNNSNGKTAANDNWRSAANDNNPIGKRATTDVRFLQNSSVAKNIGPSRFLKKNTVSVTQTSKIPKYTQNKGRRSRFSRKKKRVGRIVSAQIKKITGRVISPVTMSVAVWFGYFQFIFGVFALMGFGAYAAVDGISEIWILKPLTWFIDLNSILPFDLLTYAAFFVAVSTATIGYIINIGLYYFIGGVSVTKGRPLIVTAVTFALTCSLFGTFIPWIILWTLYLNTRASLSRKKT